MKVNEILKQHVKKDFVKIKINQRLLFLFFLFIHSKSYSLLLITVSKYKDFSALNKS